VAPGINENINQVLDIQTEEWGIEVTVVELRDIQLPDSMKRAMARQAEAECEKRAKIIAAEGEALAAGELAHASDVMMAHPLALQLRNLQQAAAGTPAPATQAAANGGLTDKLGA
jgi:regulator of protease activity HflC (stomatin/prohibitin superfamily)